MSFSESNNIERLQVSLNSTGLLGDFTPIPIPKQICGAQYRVWGKWQDPNDSSGHWVPYDRTQRNGCANGVDIAEFAPNAAFQPGSQICGAVGYSSTGTPGSEKWSSPLCWTVP